METKEFEKFGAPSTTEVVPIDHEIEQNSEKPQVRFDAKTGTLLLGLGGGEKIDANFLESIATEGFQPKDELHLTILGFKQGKLLKQVLKDRPDLIPTVEALATGNEWGIQPTGERYQLTKQYEGEAAPRQSVVEMVNNPGGAEFIAQLNQMTGLSLEEQPPHVTLATMGNPQGIGINTGQEIIELGQRIA